MFFFALGLSTDWVLVVSAKGFKSEKGRKTGLFRGERRKK